MYNLSASGDGSARTRVERESYVSLGELLQQRKIITAAQLKQAKAARKPSERIEN